jgi:hypothetical protein
MTTYGYMIKRSHCVAFHEFGCTLWACRLGSLANPIRSPLNSALRAIGMSLDLLYWSRLLPPGHVKSPLRIQVEISEALIP